MDTTQAKQKGTAMVDRKKQFILIGTNDPQVITELVPALVSWYSIEVCTCSPEIFEEVRKGDEPDLIILDATHLGVCSYIELLIPRLPNNTMIASIIRNENPELNKYEQLLMDFGCHYVMRMPLVMPVIMAQVRNMMLTKIKLDMLEQIALTDPLTGVSNRRRLDENFNFLTKQKSTYSVVSCDIDFFKKINDLRGHEFGDECLVKVAKVLNVIVERNGGIFGRMGGEEFCAIFPEIDHGVAKSIAEIMRHAVEDIKINHPDSNASKYVTVSVGVATQRPDEKNRKSVIERADDCMYQSKTNGRNRVTGEI